MGRDGRLPWRIPEDFQFFLQQTAGQIVIAGRVSYQSWTRAAGDGRRPVVITRDRSLARDGVRVADSLTGALALAEPLPGEIYVCGGQRIFEEAIVRPEARTLHLTLVHAELAGDRHFPDWRHGGWRESARRESHDAHFRYSFLRFER